MDRIPADFKKAKEHGLAMRIGPEVEFEDTENV